MTFHESKVQLDDYLPAQLPGEQLHGIALCSIDEEDLEPVLVYRAEEGALRLLNGPVALAAHVPRFDLRALVGGRSLGTLSDAQHAELEAAIRRRVEELDAVRVTVAKYHPYPVPAKRRGVVIGAVQCELDGELVEPLLVVRDRDRRIIARRVDELPLRGGGVFDLRPHHYGIRFEPPQFTPELREELQAAVRRAVRGAP